MIMPTKNGRHGWTRSLQPNWSKVRVQPWPLAAVGCTCLLAGPSGSMMNHLTTMPKTKVALTLDAHLIEQVDELVERRRFRNRSQAVEAALADKLRRLARTRLATESAKLNPREEKRLADEGLAAESIAWPEY